MKENNTRRGNTQEGVNAVNQNKCHSRRSLSGIFHACRCKNKVEILFNNNRCVEDPQLQPLGMTPNLMGFTLIELLVVVLIIGILAAVAVPQYQAAVAKSRYSTIKNLVDSLLQAQHLYYLANDTYAPSLTQLDIDLPTGSDPAKSTATQYYYPWGMVSIGTNGSALARIETSNLSVQYQAHQIHSGIQNRRICVAEDPINKPLGNKVCQLETGKTTPDANLGIHWNAYYYN